MIKNCVISGFYLLTSLLVLSCGGGNKTVKTEQPSVDKSFANQVKTTKATLSNEEKEMSLTGKIVSDPDKTIHYIPLISGVIERTYFSLGDKVEKGQTLMDIRSTELSALYSEQIRMEGEVKIAEREQRTAQSMYDDQMLSERELFEAQSRLAQAQTGLAKVKDDMSMFGTNKGNGVFSVKAPMSGYVIDKRVSSGSTVSAQSDPLFTIADLSTVWIIANIYASNLLFVREGMDAKITTLSYPNEVFEGKVNAISQVFDPEDKALKARIILDNKELKFKSEMSVVIKLKDTTQHGLVSVPSEALIFDNDLYYVVVKVGANDYLIKQVVPFDHNSTLTYLTSGVAVDEEVVVKNQLLLYAELKNN